MRPDQRKKLIGKFDDALLSSPVHSERSTKSSVKASESVPSSVKSPSDQISGASSSRASACQFSIAAEDSVLSLHREVVSGM